MKSFKGSVLYPINFVEGFLIFWLKLFPRFDQNKMIVFISARVHPGEVPSSYVMRGIINFLLDPYNVFAFFHTLKS